MPNYYADLMLDVPRGAVHGYTSVNKFGRSTNVDSGVATDIWDRANATNNQAVWLAPTAARVHAIVSASASDAAAGVGARTLRVYGLKTWSSLESYEDVTLNGTTPVNTANSYVIIHRMQVLTWGTSGPNVGLITATAATDSTVTAQIGAGNGQTLMAIYGIPSGVTAFMTGFYGSILRANLGANSVASDMTLLFNPRPDSVTTKYLVKHTIGLNSGGANPMRHAYAPLSKFTGPGIIKLRATGGADNLDVSAGFDLILTEDAKL